MTYFMTGLYEGISFQSILKAFPEDKVTDYS